VVDISHPAFEEQIRVVTETLKELDAANKPQILVFNKTDAYRYIPKEEDDLTPVTQESLSLEEMEKTWMARSGIPTVFISALKKWNIAHLRDLIYEKTSKIHAERYPYDDFLY